MRAGEGVAGHFCNITPTYLFFGECKYWFMVPVEEFDPNAQTDDQWGIDHGRAQV